MPPGVERLPAGSRSVLSRIRFFTSKNGTTHALELVICWSTDTHDSRRQHYPSWAGRHADACSHAPKAYRRLRRQKPATAGLPQVGLRARELVTCCRRCLGIRTPDSEPIFLMRDVPADAP